MFIATSTFTTLTLLVGCCSLNLWVQSNNTIAMPCHAMMFMLTPPKLRLSAVPCPGLTLCDCG